MLYDPVGRGSSAVATMPRSRRVFTREGSDRIPLGRKRRSGQDEEGKVMNPSAFIFIFTLLLLLLLLTRSFGKRTPQLRDYRACPHCDEPILFQARVCRHCNRTVTKGMN